jgi:hypothetical protein
MKEGRMDKFTLEIKLGNDAMQDQCDVARALAKLAGELTGRSGTIRDDNGNRVGTWSIN